MFKYPMCNRKFVLALSMALGATLTLSQMALAASDSDEFPESRTYGAKDQMHEVHGVSQVYKTRSLLGKNQLALTFDDGPVAATTPQLLDTLKRFGAKATFFLVASKITPETLPIVERMLREGHKIGNHSWAHADSRKQSEEAFRKQFQQSELVIERIKRKVTPVQREVYYRFPFAAYGYQSGYQHMNVIKQVSQKLFGDNCINMVFWNMDSADYVSGMTAREIFGNARAYFEGGPAITYHVERGGKITKKPYVVTQPPKGGVILMHDTHQPTVDAAALILDWAARSGVQIVPLDAAQEYSFEGKTCELKPEFHEGQ